MSVRALRNGRFIADRMINGKRHTKTCKTEEEAIYWDKKFQFECGSAYMDEMELSQPGPPLRDFIDEVFWPSKQHLRANTVASYERIIQSSILPVLGDVPFNKITPQLVQQMINSRPTRRSGELAREVLSSILAIVVDGRIYSINPAGLRFTYSAPNLRGSREGEILSTYAAQSKLLKHVAIHHAGDSIERLIVLGLEFGLRPQEVYGLDWENVSFDGGYIHINQAYISNTYLHLERTKTPAGVRRIPMSRYAAERMSSWSKTPITCSNLFGEDAHPVVVNKLGDRISQHTGRDRIMSLRSELYDDGTPVPKVTQESLRHSFGTAAAVEAGVDLEILRRLMGHTNAATTRRYIRPQLRDLETAVEALDAFKSAAGL